LPWSRGATDAPAGRKRSLSGTARASRGILVENKYAENGITRDGLDRMWDLLLDAGRADPDRIPGLKSARAPVLPGGFAIMYAIFEELDIDADDGVGGGAAPRRALLTSSAAVMHHDMREATARSSCAATRWTQAQAARGQRLALRIYDQLAGKNAGETIPDRKLLDWAARLAKSGSRSRMRSTTSHSPTCSRTPTCRASRASSSSGSRASCSRTAASSRKCGPTASRTATGTSCLRCASPSTLLRRRTRVRLPALRAIAGGRALFARAAEVLARADALTRRARNGSGQWEAVGRKFAVRRMS
jgi:exopolyphosphatase/guanosine-5'-triphosphate,3'-diphosphate pyrophosphatase